MGERDDRGLTLVELLISGILFVTVGTLATLSLDTFLNISNQVHSSYANTQQILPVSTNIQRLIRTVVEPGPQSGTPLKPVPPFQLGAISTTSVTFYANVGIAATGTHPGRPAKVVAQLVGTTFTVTSQLADADTCPSTTSPTAVCTFTANPAKRVASITNVVNSTYATAPATAPTPVFSYVLLNAAGVQSTVPVASLGTTFSTTSCTGVGDLCPADEIQGVEIDLFVKSPGSRSLAPAEDDTIVYRLSSTSFLYSPTVG
jgi:Tfp pilus assembly protein PilV